MEIIIRTFRHCRREKDVCTAVLLVSLGVFVVLVCLSKNFCWLLVFFSHMHTHTFCIMSVIQSTVLKK